MAKKPKKSLKLFFKKQSIEKEVKDKWTPDQRYEYLMWHCEKDKKQSSLSKQKLQIVFKYVKIDDDLVDAILKNESTRDIITKDTNELKNILNSQTTIDAVTDNKAAIEDILKDQNTKKLILKDETVLKNVLNKEKIRDLIINDKAALEDILQDEKLKSLIIDNTKLLVAICENKNMNEKIKADRKFRKLLLANSKMTSEELKRYFNLDPSICDPKEYDNLSVKNSGISLWKKGYDVKGFLGAGTFGVVWRCDGKNGPKAIKVVKNDNSGIEEIKNAKKLYELFKGDEQAKKYFNLLKAKKDDPILKAVLAQGDLFDEMSEKGNIGHMKSGKTIDSILRNAVQALKSVQALHKKGYSHNDIKLENFLKIGNWSGKKEKEDAKSELQERSSEVQSILKTENIDDKLEKLDNFLTTNKIKIPKIEKIKNSKDIGKEEKVKQMESAINDTMNKKSHKHRVQLADFGTVTPIPTSGKETFMKVYTPGYVSKTDEQFLDQEVGKEIIEKRDVYALGRVFAELLFKGTGFSSETEVFKVLYSLNPDLNTIKASKLYNFLNKSYSGENNDQNERIANFMLVIRKMLTDGYSDRISLDDALKEVQKIKATKIG